MGAYKIVYYLDGEVIKKVVMTEEDLMDLDETPLDPPYAPDYYSHFEVVEL